MVRPALSRPQLVAIGVAALAVVAVTAAAVGAWPAIVPPGSDSPDTDPVGDGDASVQRFGSAEAVRAYFAANGPDQRYLTMGLAAGGVRLDGAPPGDRALQEADASGDGTAGGGGGADGLRYSETNVQELGIDEPDLLKSDGRTLFYSRRGASWGPVTTGPEPAVDAVRPGPAGPGIRVVDASEPATPSIAGTVNASGRQFLLDDRLVVLGGDGVVGFDVSAPGDPVREWTTTVDGRVAAARAIDGTIYLVVQRSVDPADPCPVTPAGDATIECTDLFRPSEPATADATVSVVAVDPADGEILDATAFAAASWQSAVYVSAESIYVTYPAGTSAVDAMLEYLRSADGRRHLDAATVDRLDRVAGYDLSPRARAMETRYVLETYLSSLAEDRRAAVREAIGEGYAEYRAANKRTFTRTGIVRVGLEDLSVRATGSVPGRVLNQFSMDEHEGHLRIATTVPGHGGPSENDLYVLDRSLSITGSVTGMGLEERVYSVRFVGDEGYVVTFRQIDPFHVLDLSDPTDPTLEGELKLPGFSSYLHPLGEDRILGIGQEDGQVKVVSFDVSTPTDPTIAASMVLEDRWSAVSASHHAFLQDERHEVVFVPGNEGGHVISYAGAGLERVTTIEVPGVPNRAAYVGEYLYVFSPDGLVVVDERSWERTATLDFDDADAEQTEAPPDDERTG